MASGSPRNVTVDGLSFRVAADANIALEPLVEKEVMPHSGGALIKETVVAGSATAVKLTVTPSEYELLKGLSEESDPIPVSFETRDGSVFRTTGGISLGPFQTEDFSCEIEILTTTGVWDNFSAS